MLPGMNKRQAEQLMRQMGIKQEPVEALEVVIRTPTHEIVVLDPDVQKVNMMGQETFQIMGRVEKRSLSTEPDISEEDIETVMSTVNCSKDKAFAAIKEAKGDLAQAILHLQK